MLGVQLVLEAVYKVVCHYLVQLGFVSLHICEEFLGPRVVKEVSSDRV